MKKDTCNLLDNERVLLAVKLPTTSKLLIDLTFAVQKHLTATGQAAYVLTEENEWLIFIRENIKEKE